MRRLCGLDLAAYLSEFERHNLVLDPSGSWPVREAALRAERMSVHLSGKRVLLLGRRVARAFGTNDAPWFEWAEFEAHSGVKFLGAVFPHPSGLSRYWNSPRRTRDAQTWIRGQL